MANFVPCTTRKGATDKINRNNLTTTYGLKEQGETGEVFHMLDPDKGWIAAQDAARVLDADLVSCLISVNYTLQMEMKLYQAADDIDFPNVKGTKRDDTPLLRENFTDKYTIIDRVIRKFNSTRLMTFMGWSIKDSYEIADVAPRGTSMEDMRKWAMMYEADIVYCQCRANYTITGLTKLEATYDDLRRGNI